MVRLIFPQGRFFLPIILILLVAFPAFSRGKQEEEEEGVINNGEWVLAIVNLDVSDLPPSRQIMGGVMLRSLTQSLRDVEHRIRSGEEIQYYQDFAWTRAQTEAARALAAKHNERDLLLFRGEPDWRYQRLLKTIEDDLVRLEENIITQRETIPSVEAKPLIRISNLDGPWPAPPTEGEEYRFCIAQRADAFLTGTASEFHGRIFLTLRLYTLYSRSYSWEEDIIFSSQDLNSAMAEMSGRLVATVSGTEPAGIIVHAEPPDAMILIDNNLAGMGEVPFREQVPGSVELAVYADNYRSVVFPLEIEAGEIAEIFVNLTPLVLSGFTVDVPESPGSSVYIGSLFMGRTPLNIEIPENQLSFISVETPSGETGTMIVQGSDPVRGSAEFVYADNTMVFRTGVPVSAEEARVATARRNFYSAFGRFWITLPVSLFAIGLADTYISAHDYQPNSSISGMAQASTLLRGAAFGAIGLSVAETAYRIYRYLRASGTDGDPIARFESPEPLADEETELSVEAEALAEMEFLE